MDSSNSQEFSRSTPPPRAAPYACIIQRQQKLWIQFATFLYWNGFFAVNYKIIRNGYLYSWLYRVWLVIQVLYDEDYHENEVALSSLISASWLLKLEWIYLHFFSTSLSLSTKQVKKNVLIKPVTVRVVWALEWHLSAKTRWTAFSIYLLFLSRVSQFAIKINCIWHAFLKMDQVC